MEALPTSSSDWGIFLGRVAPKKIPLENQGE